METSINWLLLIVFCSIRGWLGLSVFHTTLSFAHPHPAGPRVCMLSIAISTSFFFFHSSRHSKSPPTNFYDSIVTLCSVFVLAWAAACKYQSWNGNDVSILHFCFVYSLFTQNFHAIWQPHRWPSLAYDSYQNIHFGCNPIRNLNDSFAISHLIRLLILCWQEHIRIWVLHVPRYRSVAAI